MENRFIEMKPEELKDNPFKLIGSDWMLITAGNIGSYNTMTASWGGLGVLWSKNIAFCVVRPTRYTYGFIEKSEQYTLSFFEGRFREALSFCGSHSGREYDKASETGLIPVQAGETVYFSQARLVLVCKKLYYQDLDPRHFLDPDIDRKNYPDKDYHRMYVGEIVQCLAKQD